MASCFLAAAGWESARGLVVFGTTILGLLTVGVVASRISWRASSSAAWRWGLLAVASVVLSSSSLVWLRWLTPGMR